MRESQQGTMEPMGRAPMLLKGFYPSEPTPRRKIPDICSVLEPSEPILTLGFRVEGLGFRGLGFRV